MASVEFKNIRDSQNPQWVQCNLEKLFNADELQTLSDSVFTHQEASFSDKTAPTTYDFPDFGASRLQPSALQHICKGLSGYLERAIAPVSDIPAYMVMERQGIVWERVVRACQQQIYSDANLTRVVAAMTKEDEEEEEGGRVTKKKEEKALQSPTLEKLSGNDILVEMGVTTGLSVVFSLLKQAWAQLAWQRQVEQQLQASGMAALSLPAIPGPQISLPNEVLRSVLGVLKGIPPLSLANVKALSKLSLKCLEQSAEFLDWVVRPESNVDEEGKRLASEILLSLTLQQGSLNGMLEWAGKALACLTSYEGCPEGVVRPTLSLEFCEHVLVEIRQRTQVSALVETVQHRAFEPRELTASGQVTLLDFILFLTQELSDVSRNCTQYFSKGENETEDRFLSETCETYAFGSNSSSQLAMGTVEKFPTATLLPHMANCQLAEAGQYCSFLVYSDGTIKACGKGSYGRLGLGNSDSQAALKAVDTFPEGVTIRKVTTSRGSDGHTLAVTPEGQVYSWGDGNYGKLGHGDNVTQKVPKLISAFANKVVRQVSCGNRHTAAVTVDGELYTWGEGDYGRLGHGSSASMKTPTKVDRIELVKMVACGAAHTLALTMDGLSVYSFGSGDSGKLGHGDTNRQTTPKRIEGLSGIICQKVCTASQFSLVLTASGKVYSFGNGSGVGKGTTEPRQYSPWLIEALDGEMIIDVSTGDGHCLALTQRGEVYAWGTNSMGQCGQGHSNGSITTPSKVQGLDGVQVQQISTGTSHSIVWTAVPVDRRASALWHWPYCVSVGEKTFQQLLGLLKNYGSVSEQDTVPQLFRTREFQHSFVLSMLSLIRIHLGLAAPLGSSCVHMACGSQVKPLRNFLFKLIDSQLPPELDQVTSDSLEVGSSVLLPPVLDRLNLLLSILPEDPAQISSLSVGQQRQLDILLGGFQDKAEFAGVLVDQACLDAREKSLSGKWEWESSGHSRKLFALCRRMVNYIRQATMVSLDPSSFLPESLRLGSQLLDTFQKFVLAVFTSTVSFVEKYVLDICCIGDITVQLDAPPSVKHCVMLHLGLFHDIVRESSLPVLKAIVDKARASEDPVAFLQTMEAWMGQELYSGALFGFLAYQFPSHVALASLAIPGFAVCFNLDELFLQTARSVHDILALFPPETTEKYEREELHFEPLEVNPKKARVAEMRGGKDGELWRRLADMERLCCWSAARLAKFMYISTNMNSDDGRMETEVLEFKPSKGKQLTLLSSHLLSNGVVGGVEELAEALHTWISLCETLTFLPEGAEDRWGNYVDDYKYFVEDESLGFPQNLLQERDKIAECDPKTALPLLALAIGAEGNDTAELIYKNMMDFANYRDWNTCSDEPSVPQLRQVSCALLACLLKHTGLFVYASNCRTKPKKKLVDVYRAVFAMRREVFTNRPIPKSEPAVVPSGIREFIDTCDAICATLFFLLSVLSPALPEETEPIVPQISAATPTGASTSADDVAVRSPGSLARGSSMKGPVRLFSHPETRDDSSPVSHTQPQDPLISHSASHTAPSPSQHKGWSLAAVKQALSQLKWQRDRMDMHTTTSTGAEGPLHQKITGVIVDLVSQVFQQEDKDLLNRKELLSTLVYQQRRAMHRRDALQKVVKFVSHLREDGELLPSSRIIYLSQCLAHNVHYSENITAAPSALQHEIKSLSHQLLEDIVSRMHRVEPSEIADSSVLGLHRELLLILQWVNFQHEPSDLYLLFAGDFYSKVVTISGVVSSRVQEDISLPSSRLVERLNMSCVFANQLLALRVGMNAEVLKSRPDILATVSDHLYGQLEGFISAGDPRIARKWGSWECTVEKREKQLGEFLSFVNTLSATHEVIRSVLASDVWFGTLLRIVDIDTSTGIPVVSSLKTRMLALQFLGAIMSEFSDTSSGAQAKCAKIIEDLLELMYRCMFLASVSHFQDSLKAPADQPLTEGQTIVLPFAFDSLHQRGCQVTVDGDTVKIEAVGRDEWALGHHALSSGRYTWKVSVASPNSAFSIGVGEKPLDDRSTSSTQLWAFESHTGRLYHEGESNDLMFTVTEGDSITVEYDARGKTLAFGKNEEELRVAFQNVVKQTKELYPMVLFNSRRRTVLQFHPISRCSHSPLAHLKHQEQISSGYPLLSPMAITLTQSVVGIIYQLQDKEPWSAAISQVISEKLSEMNFLMERLLDRQLNIQTEQRRREAETSSSRVYNADTILTPLSLLMEQLVQVVWPCLAVIGGLDTGLCLGRLCQVEGDSEGVIGTIVSTPDSEQKVVVQDQVTATTAQVKKRTVLLGTVKLLAQSRFSLPLITPHLSPATLLNITRLAGYLDHHHSLTSILHQAHTLTNSLPLSIAKCLPYHQLCNSILQMAATKSLHSVLFDESVLKLLSFQPPPVEVVISGSYVNKSELAETVKEVLKCLAARSIKPSPLKPTLRLVEMERVHAVLSYECLAAVAEYMLHHGLPSPMEDKEVAEAASSLSALPEDSPPSDSTPGDGEQAGEQEEVGEDEEAAARPATPPMVQMILDMGFTRAQVNVAMQRCDIPANMGEQARMNLVITWIIENPDAVSEEEARLDQVQQDTEAEEAQQREEERQQREANQTAAANEFLSLFGEMFEAAAPSPDPLPTGSDEREDEGKKDTKHAPALLEGPNVDDEVPGVILSGLDTSPQSLKSLLSALGLSQKRPTPRRFQFSGSDPLGESLCKSMNEREGEGAELGEGETEGEGGMSGEEDGAGNVFRMSSVCEDAVQQAQKLRSLGETVSAIRRISEAAQTMVARQITMLVIASLSTHGSDSFIASLRALGLVDVQSLIRLLRLVHAGRIDGTPGKSFSLTTQSSLQPIKGLECLSSAISTVVTDSVPAGSQLMQACSRDLLAAAVGGAELLQKSTRRRRRRIEREKERHLEKDNSDVTILCNPNFSVSQSLVQTMAETAGKAVLSDSTGVLQMTDALAACLFSSKLQPEYRFWALEQLLRVFSASSKKEQAESMPPDVFVEQSQLVHLTGHKAQIMASAQNKREGKIVSIGEDNALVVWDLEGKDLESSPETRTFPFTRSSPPTSPSPSAGLLLPTLTQSFNHTCVAGAINDELCVWRVRDGNTTHTKLPELITALQWKPGQKEGEAPLLLVGLVDGQLVLVEVLRASVNLTLETQTTVLEHLLKGAVCCLGWSPCGSRFAVASTPGCVQIYSGVGREYTATLEIKEIQVTDLCWSPDEVTMATLEGDGILKLWSSDGEAPTLTHTFSTYKTCCMIWHGAASETARTLLASGSQDGGVHLWVVDGKRESSDQSESEPLPTNQSELSTRVAHVATLHGHQAPITTLAFSEEAALLASGCKAGSVRVWDLKSFEQLKCATRAVGEVLHVSWTNVGLTVCYKNTSTLCLLSPGPSEYLSERCIHSCLPSLHLHGVSETSKAPCLMALLGNLHHVLLDQYQYEEGEVSSGQQLVHSEYLQLLTALAVGLGLHHVLVSPPHPPHFPPLPPAKEWKWLSNFTQALKISEAFNKRTHLPKDTFSLPKDMEPLDPSEKYQTADNSVWTLTMDTQILEWAASNPQDWWQSCRSRVYTWGKGSWNQLGHSTRERSLPAIADDWQDVRQVVAGSHCTYTVKFDGTVASVGEGSYGRLGHGGSENETNLRSIASLQGIPVVQVVAGSRVSTSTDEGFALALTNIGDVYSWGKAYKGRLGHSTTESCRTPKLVEALAGKDIKMLACCDYHCAAVTTTGDVYTFGSKENGKLGLGRDTPSGSTGHVTQVTKFMDSDETTELANIKIGYVSCGQTFTIAISEDGSQVFACGKADSCSFGVRGFSGDHYFPMLLSHLSGFGPFVKSCSGNKVTALINTRGQLCWFGKLCDSQSNGVVAELVQFPTEEKIVDVTTASQYMLAIAEGGEVYSWGKNSSSSYELGYESSAIQSTPKLVEALSQTERGIIQISAGARHVVCSDCPLPVRGVTNTVVPSAVPSQYSALKEVPCRAIHARLLLLNHFTKIMVASWRLYSSHLNKSDTARFHINPLSDGNTRALISTSQVEGMMAGVMSRTMVNKSHGPSITIQRLAQDNRASRAVFPQIASQILQKSPKDFRCPSRAWKVNLIGEGADDAGGVFDETMAQMCEELEHGTVKLLIPTPNASNKCGFNTDRFVFNPSCNSRKDLKHFRFLGILFGVAMRTKKPLDLHLAQPVWKLLAGMALTAEDLEEVDMMFIQALYGIRDIHKSGIQEEDFSEMIPLECFEAQSMNGKFVPIVPGGGNIKLTFQNRKEYVEKALHFRLHELDQQVAAVREGMSTIVPVPLLSLCTARMLETSVCGQEEVDLWMLKKVVRYRDNLSENDQIVRWLWQTLDSFTNEEKILFLRFVSGRSRLPARVSEIPQRFQIMKWGQSTDALPTSQTCFFQIRLPNYTSCEVMCEKLRYAIRHCRSIDMDTYMLRRNNSGDSGEADLIDYDSEEDFDSMW